MRSPETCANWPCWFALGIKVAYEALSWGAQRTELDHLLGPGVRAPIRQPRAGPRFLPCLRCQDAAGQHRTLDPARIFLVQLSDFMRQETPSFEDAWPLRAPSGCSRRAFIPMSWPTWCCGWTGFGYRGDYSYEVFNDDYQQLPLATVAQRARRSTQVVA